MFLNYNTTKWARSNYETLWNDTYTSGPSQEDTESCWGLATGAGSYCVNCIYTVKTSAPRCKPWSHSNDLVSRKRIQVESMSVSRDSRFHCSTCKGKYALEGRLGTNSDLPVSLPTSDVEKAHSSFRVETAHASVVGGLKLPLVGLQARGYWPRSAWFQVCIYIYTNIGNTNNDYITYEYIWLLYI